MCQLKLAGNKKGGRSAFFVACGQLISFAETLLEK
jgi:hypothetical protein